MGVHGLWELLAPVGRRVSVESLGSRKLAIDASIWIVQFMKAMRDDRGDMIRNAHLLGFFRRICKLLFLRVKPVFVFDGGTPALKRRTVIARRRQREQAQSRIRKTAEKLLLNHLRTRKLEEIAGKSGSVTNSTGKDINNDKVEHWMDGSEDISAFGAAHGGVHKHGSGGRLQGDEAQEMKSWDEVEAEHLDEEDEEDEELVYLPSKAGNIDPAVLASLPASMQLNLLVQMREQLVAENRHKFQKVAKAPSSFSQLQIEAYLKTVAFRRGINEAQRAAAGKGVGGVPSTRIASETNREFIFSTSYQGDKTALTGEGGGNAGLKPPEPKAQPPAVSTSTLLSTNFSSLPFKEGSSSTELGEAEQPDSAVQTYVDEKGRTRVSRIRGMGVRMTRDLQWNLYLMKDVEKRQALEETKDDDNDALAHAGSLVNNGDGELFQRLMVGDNASLADTLSGVPSKEGGERGQLVDEAPLEANQSTRDGGLHNDSAVGADVMPQQSSIQITFDSNEDAADADLDLFRNLVAGEAGPQELEPSSEPVPVAGENEDDDCEWEDGGAREVDLGLKESNAVEDRDQQDRPYAPSGNDVSFAGDSDAELAFAIQESLAEHDRLRASQPGNYPDSEDTGLSEDSDTGDSGESEVEWEDGSGAMAVPAVGCTVTGLTLTQEELEVQEATRRSLNDVASWRVPVRPLTQLVIREPVEGGAKMLVESVPRAWEQEAVDRSFQIDSEEARIARERARKGKAVADETINDSPGPVGVIRTTVSPAGVESEVGSLQEKVDGRGTFQGSHLENNENVPPSKGSSVKVLSYNLVGNEEVDSDLVRQNLKIVANGAESSIETRIDSGTEVSQFLEIRSFEKPGIVEMPEMLEEVKPVPDVVEKGDRGSSLSPGQPDTLSSGAYPKFVKPSSDMKDSGLAMEDMLKDAEQMDMAKEQEEMLEHEAALLAEREALARDEAELQAALEKQQEELLERIEKERELLREEEAELLDMQKKNERNAESVTSEMFAECQELLQMFGIPYVIAPMEAEAQCAFLDAEKLVDGVVTDDVDVFLFGARNVHKNIFDDRKYVETYYMKDVETDLGLSRDKLIQMALLLGSDYTEGISGIGIVNAIEVVNAYDEEDGLKKFKEMVESVDIALLGLGGRGLKRTGSQGETKKAGGKGENGGTEEKDDINEGSESAGNGNGPDDTGRTRRQEAFMETHRAVSKNWKIPESFPSEAVVAEYKGPRVDKSKQAFSWGRPDLEALRKFCFERFSWSKEKADELLLSVLKEYDRQETQLRLDAFYSFNQRFAKVRSARIQKALRGTTGRLAREMVDIPSAEGGPPAKKQRQKKATSKTPAERIATELAEEDEDLNAVEGSQRGAGDIVGNGRGRKKKVAVSGRGRGRGKGRGTGRGRGRGGRSSGVSVGLEGDSSAHSSETDHDVEEAETGRRSGVFKRKLDDQILPVRRSSRARRGEAKYRETAGSDDGGDSSENEDDISSSGDSPKLLQPASTEDQLEGLVDDHRSSKQGGDLESLQPEVQLEGNIDDQAGAGHRDGDVHRTSEQGGDLEAAEVPKSYLFSGGGFCLPDEEDEISASAKGYDQLDEAMQPEVHEVANANLGSSQHDAVGSVTTNAPTEAQELTQPDVGDDPVKIPEVGANAKSGFRAIPFLRKKRPPKQP